MKKQIITIGTFMMLAMASVSLSSCGGESAKTESHEHTAEYQCPMDCEKGKTYDQEGECPVCHMALKEVEHAH